MRSIKKLSAAAVAAAILSVSSCAVKNPGAAEFTRRADAPSEVAQTTTAERPAVEAEATAETEQPAETTTAETTTAAPEPVKLKSSVLSDHAFSAEDFPKKVYSNKKLKKALAEIDDICSRYGTTISFEYKNMESCAVCRYNEYASYGCCSTVKAPFCKELLERGADLDDEIAISVKWDNDGGTAASMAYGDTLSARELIRLAITESDNTAYYNLINYYGYDGFNSMNYELGVNYDLGYSWIFNYCTAEDLMRQYEDIYDYAEKSERGKWLIKLMTKTDRETQITAQLGEKYTVAHKYGSDWDQNCYHDCAIVFADSPFVLVIMTDQTPETEESDKVFKQLAKQFDIVNSQLAV